MKLWGVVAAVVSACAGVASAIAAFTGGTAHPSAAPVASAAVDVAPPPGTGFAGTSPAVAPAPSPAGASPVRWTGKWVLGLEGIDLTKVPPARSTSFVFFRPAAGRSGSSGMMVKGTVARWTGPGEPTAQGCRDLLLTQPHDQVDVVEGDSVCVVNENSPIAVIKITETHYDQGSYGELDTEVTIWNLRMTR
ncbi:hypothetical protein KNE206_43470 [Kitasatospora sp. NE20-6]|uniref:hypothetical protein n=1 Tax=Kitasatospora sp. NE20-6 TaxID=2859066 RepID=UPI0034DBDEDF